MTEEHATTLISNIEHAVKVGDQSQVSNAMAMAMKAMVHCQYRQGQRVKDVLKHIGTIDNNFARCPARLNDMSDHEQIKELRSRIDAMDRREEIKIAQRETVTRMVRAFYAATGAAGGAVVLKLLDAFLG